MATLTSQAISEAGLTATYAAADAAGDVVANDGSIFLHVKNGGGSEVTVTITAQVTEVDSGVFGTLTKGNASDSIAATTGESFIGPFPIGTFNNSDEQIAITYSAVTSVTIAVFYLA